MNRQSILGLTVKELEDILSNWQEKKFHAKQIFSWLYKRRAKDFDTMSDLSLSLRELLTKNFYLFSFDLIKRLVSKDGTEKFLFGLRDRNFIEAVLIPTEKRVAVCISTQVGCKFACIFCASGISGFRRNLSCAEIVGEILYLKNNYSAKEITHIVFMGIGEPLDNYDNLIKAIRIINSTYGLNIGARRITVSTCGIIPALKNLAKEGLQIELSISLHAADEKTRTSLMPINRIYSLRNLITAAREYTKETNRQVTFEYVLIRGINSSLQNAKDLSKILKGWKLCKLNLITANPVKKRKIAPLDPKEAALFKDYLLSQGINVTLRRPRGGDIDAACGQLRLKMQNSK